MTDGTGSRDTDYCSVGQGADERCCKGKLTTREDQASETPSLCLGDEAHSGCHEAIPLTERGQGRDSAPPLH